MKKREREALIKLRAQYGRPLVIDDKQHGYCFVDRVTAEHLAARGVARIESRPFHEFLFGR